ncbi:MULTISPECIES: hypothetical protein [Nocardioides]|uniref:Uncharacterized protein n=1 Tax=Nocardioides vastitatis TaxID=2568655 RepID=A0ABW0ZJD2_9ACTN|nr:hypothetical protein [Nocardioides sp.]THI97252.1 hypothetical protein E7Z54_14860 [Nocardioides sp.]
MAKHKFEVPPDSGQDHGQQQAAEDLSEEATGLDGTPVEQLQEERAERLDPRNRPENAEVDNTDRELDVEKGMFTDESGYEDAPRKYPPADEQGA